MRLRLLWLWKRTHHWTTMGQNQTRAKKSPRNSGDNRQKKRCDRFSMLLKSIWGWMDFFDELQFHLHLFNILNLGVSGKINSLEPIFNQGRKENLLIYLCIVASKIHYSMSCPLDNSETAGLTAGSPRLGLLSCYKDWACHSSFPVSSWSTSNENHSFLAAFGQRGKFIIWSPTRISFSNRW